MKKLIWQETQIYSGADNLSVFSRQNLKNFKKTGDIYASVTEMNDALCNQDKSRFIVFI